MSDTLPPSADVLKLGNFLCFAIYSAGHAFNRAYKPLLDRLGLTYPQFLVMVALWEQDGQTVGGLGARLHLESSTLTPLIKRLEAMGHVRRARDPKDERQVRVSLTGMGRALKDQAKDIPACLVAAMGLSVADIVRLQGEIARLRDALEAAATPT
ncbi:MarR family winged helix-turn-helix transcriptional regulator [Polymorphum gilvum]|uniref:Probable transcriptional regulator protein, MarR family n=1 Tax=Polymorphum gilvum (strain LMG 25793 / CGMCC 1.9160 / SL003B-26A1) TaxID=991905 RepID=F2J4F5_POLGS|nr:MarR family transcriptional regulator [Polymorphum gilvum]ADZ71097.1 Probable transcriptional regulator protein, MarR family [Polymorphum gilvum SL003B-26A1]